MRNMILKVCHAYLFLNSGIYQLDSYLDPDMCLELPVDVTTQLVSIE